MSSANAEIEWGDWIPGPGDTFGDVYQLEVIDGKYRHRVPKPKLAMIHVYNEVITWPDGVKTHVQVTRSDDGVTTQVLP